MIGRAESFADRTTPFRWGASDVLFAPFHPEVLRLRVNGWVRQQRLRRRLRGDLYDNAAPPTTDRLTRLYGHGFLHGYVDHLIGHAACRSRSWASQSRGWAGSTRTSAMPPAIGCWPGSAPCWRARGGRTTCRRASATTASAWSSAAPAAARRAPSADRIATIVTQTPFAVGGGERIGIDLRIGIAQLSHGDDAAR